MAKPGRFRRRQRVREATATSLSAKKTHHLTGVLYDTDTLIEILRGNRSVVRAALNLEEKGSPTYTTPISWAGVFAGIRPGEEPIARAFFETRGEVTIDGVTGRLAGLYLARYATSHGLEVAEALVAAAATTSDLPLWTQNQERYPMPDIRFYKG